MLRKPIALLALLCVLCAGAASVCRADQSPDPTIPPKEASTVEYLFNANIDQVNSTCHSLMESIGSAENFSNFSMTSWPTARGSREPEWDDFRPDEPNYIPPFLGKCSSAKDTQGNIYCRYVIDLLDLTFDDWEMVVVNAGAPLACEFSDARFYSDYFPEAALSPEEFILSRPLAPNVKTSFHLSAAAQQNETEVFWEDEDYAITWVWRYSTDGNKTMNLLKLQWKAPYESVYALFDDASGKIINAIISSENQ